MSRSILLKVTRVTYAYLAGNLLHVDQRPSPATQIRQKHT